MQTHTALTKQVPNAVIWKSLYHLVHHFKLKEKEARILMGDMSRSTYTTGKAILNRDQKERVSYLLGIYKSLHILFDDSEQAMSWIERANNLPPFNGITPKEYMLEGSIVRLSEVRELLNIWFRNDLQLQRLLELVDISPTADMPWYPDKPWHKFIQGIQWPKKSN